MLRLRSVLRSGQGPAAPCPHPTSGNLFWLIDVSSFCAQPPALLPKTGRPWTKKPAGRCTSSADCGSVATPPTKNTCFGCAPHHRMYPGPANLALRMPSTITPVPRPGLLRQIGFFSATALVISNMVGTGIFATTGFMAGDLGSARLILACWGVGALFALAGAVSYSELGINFPSSGGEYVYLTHAFGPEWGFMTGWVSFFAGFSAPIAAAALAFSDYLGYFFPALKQANATLVIGSGAFTLRLGAGQMTASALIAAFTVLNCLGVGRAAKVQNVLTTTKLVVIAGFVIIGFAAGTGDWHHFSEHAVRTSTVALPTQFMISLLWVMVGYSGWNAATYVAEEVRRPERTLPAAIAAGSLIVAVLYLALNMIFIYATPLENLKGVIAVGTLSASNLFGPPGAGGDRESVGQGK